MDHQALDKDKKAKLLGKLGEDLATEFLKKKKYEILERNYTFEKAEIDIICNYNERIVFVEVKTRMSPYLNDPALMIPSGKWKKIMRAADNYMKNRSDDLEAQFDIVSVVTNKEYTIIDHYDRAYIPGVT